MSTSIPQELIDSVIDQIEVDVLVMDFTAIEDLLRHVPEEALNAYLSEAK